MVVVYYKETFGAAAAWRCQRSSGYGSGRTMVIFGIFCPKITVSIFTLAAAILFLFERFQNW